jgi:DNA-directed RNA polymerase specialized sigma24 family protein
VNQHIFNYLEEQSETLADRFSRCEGMLYFIAAQVLGKDEFTDSVLCDAVSDAVHNCWHAAARNPQSFDRQGAFRSWLVRILFDESIAILHQARKTSLLELRTESAVLCH